MHILFVCKSLPHTFQGGIQTHVWKLSEWMLRLGHEVSILTAGSYKNGIRRVEMDGRTLIELPYLPGRKMRFVPTLAEEFAFNLAARKWLKKHHAEFDIVHLQGRSGNLFLKDKTKVKVPVVNTLHGLTGIEYQKSVGRNNATFDTRLHRLMATRMEDFSLRNADALIAVSGEMREEIAQRNPDFLNKTTIIYNGVDVPEALPIVAPDPNLLLFVGRLTAIKGVTQLVEAMRKLPENLKLIMVGDGEAKPELERLIAKHRLGKRIRLVGAQDSKQVAAWISRCSALVLPSFHETQGIVLLEANALGRPVVANAVGGVTEVVQDGKNGLLIPNNSPDEIAKAVRHLLDDPEAAARMGRWGREFVRDKFAWEQIAEQTEQLYQRLLPEIKVDAKLKSVASAKG
ncbi:MAG: glycosyltransferase family 4 protein [Saprospiraceae bacterium]|nr:glycosyltransferase family 4 protein [Saprospiraceae bacterium]